MGTAYQEVWRHQPTAGIARHVPSRDVPETAWLTAHNVAFRNGTIVKGAGWAARPLGGGSAALAGEPTNIELCRFGNEERTLILTRAGWYELDAESGVLTKLATPVVGCPAFDRWRVDALANRYWFTNQVDGLLAWDGQTVEAVDTGGIKGAELAQFRNHLILAKLATVDAAGGHNWAGSGLVDDVPPLNWNTDDPASDAVLRDIPEGGDPILAVRRFGDYLVLHKETAFHLVSYTGGDQVYSRDARSGHGLLSAGAVGALGDWHRWAGRDNLYRFAGGMPEPFGTPVFQWWLPRIERNGLRTIYTHAVPWPGIAEWWLVYQGIGDGAHSKALVFDEAHGAFVTRDCPFLALGWIRKAQGRKRFSDYAGQNVPMSSMHQSAQFVLGPGDYELIGIKADGSVHTLSENTGTANGEPLESVLETGDTDFGFGGWKQLGGMYLDVPDLGGDETLDVYVAARGDLGEALEWRGPYAYGAGMRGEVKFLAPCRYARFKFVHTGTQFSLAGYAPRVQRR